MNQDPLDALLSADVTAEPDAALRQRIVAAAPRQRSLGRTLRWMTAAAVGLGLAASCAAGVAAGLTLAPASVTRLISDHAAAATDMTSLADPGDDPPSG